MSRRRINAPPTPIRDGTTLRKFSKTCSARAFRGTQPCVRRLAVLLLLIAVVPVVFLRDEVHPSRGKRIWQRDLLPGLVASGLLRRLGPFRIDGVWQIGGDDEAIANYSALGVLSDGNLIALSDRGTVLTFSRPDRAGPWFAHSAYPLPDGHRLARRHTDGEAMVVLPPSDDLLFAYEGVPDLVLFHRDFSQPRMIRIPALAEWPDNLGPEAIAHLADGRFVMLEEGYLRWWDHTRHAGFLFPGVPHPGEAPLRFILRLENGWRPTELAPMPDGRLLLLERKFTLRGFRSALALIDPAAIRPGATVVPRQLARIEDKRIRDNFEGMTVTREADGGLAVWIVSDSNGMTRLQRTLLIKLRLLVDPGA